VLTGYLTGSRDFHRKEFDVIIGPSRKFFLSAFSAHFFEVSPPLLSQERNRQSLEGEGETDCLEWFCSEEGGILVVCWLRPPPSLLTGEAVVAVNCGCSFAG